MTKNTPAETIARFATMTQGIMSDGYMARIYRDMDTHKWEIRPCEYGSEELAVYRDGKLSGVLYPTQHDGRYELGLSNETDDIIFC